MRAISSRWRLSENQRLRLGFLTGSVIGLLLLAAWGLNLFNAARLRFDNAYFVRQETSDTLVIVALDDASLATYGRSPVEWDRSLYADLLRVLNQGGARVVTFDLLFSEPAAQDAAFAAAIEEIRRGEPRTRVILPMVGGEQLVNGDALTPPRIVFSQRLQPVPELASAAEMLAFANTFRDTDGTIRRQPSYVQAAEDDALYLSFSLATLVTYAGIPPAALPQLLDSREGELLITPELTPERVLPVDKFGIWQQHFFGQGGQTFPLYSFQAVLSGEVDPAVFEGKIVLVGLANVTGLLDQHVVPLGLNGQTMAGVEVQANAIETLLQWKPLRELPDSTQGLLIVLLSVLASLLYTGLRWYWVLPTMLLLLVIFGGVAFLLFDTQQVIMHLWDGVLALALPSVTVLGINIINEATRRRRVEFLLRSVVEISTQQLDLYRIAPLIAQDIQSVLPTEGGAIWLYLEGKPDLQLVHHWFPNRAQAYTTLRLNEEAATQQHSMMRGQQLAIPTRWQNRVLGTFVVQLPGRAIAQGEHLRLLESLAEQVAPSLDNARLYTQTERQKTLLQTIQDGSPNALIILDDTLAVLQVNPSASRLFEMQLEQFVGQSMQTLLEHTSVEPAVQGDILAKLAQPVPFFEELRLGKGFQYVYALPLVNAQHWVLIFNDVTPLAQLSDLKTQMIRMASHDLKNPLSRVMGYTEMMMDDMLEAEDRQVFMQRVQQAAEDMLAIITDILNLEQLRAGKMERAPVDAGLVVREVLSRQLPDAENKQQQLTYTLAEDVPTMQGDARLLEQVFTNLIGNAIKYTPQGGQIQVRLYAGEENTIHFEVQDNGYGIPEAAKAKLFTQFYRVRTQATAHIAGTGLGLNLVKSIVEDHGGKISFISTEGQGSTFFVELPAA